MLSKFKKSLSVILVLILCITCTSLPVYAANEAESLNEIASGTLPEVNEGTLIEAIEAEEFSVSDTFISYIDKAEFESHSFIRRLEEQEKLNTYVFENADRTRTVYYFDENLKYVDDNGQIVEKDLSIIQ